MDSNAKIIIPPPPPPIIATNGWNEYSRLVLAELERLNINYQRLEEGQTSIRIEIGKLQIKSGVWGLIGGTIPIVVTILFLLLKNGIVGV